MRDGDGARRTEDIWARRSGLSRVLRASVVVVPALAAIAVALLLTHLLAHPDRGWDTLLWWLILTAAIVLTLLVAGRLLRRLVPLAWLFDISLVFPDRAPSRYAIARASGNPRQLLERLGDAVQSGLVGTEVECTRTALGMVAALSVHDRRTRGHSERVRVFTDMLAEQLRLGPADRARLTWVALLHDIGKLTIAAEVLNKPGRPDDLEWLALRRHPEEGARIIAPLRDWLGEWSVAVIQHHERWDGAGYPDGLARKQISRGGRIIAVADAYETMTAARPYKQALTPVAARHELVHCSGSQFDPAVVRAFLDISVGRLRRAAGAGAWIAQLPLIGVLWGPLSGSGSQVSSGAVTAVAVVGLAITGAVGAGTSPALTPTTPVRSSSAAAAATPAPPALPSAPASPQPVVAADSPPPAPASTPQHYPLTFQTRPLPAGPTQPPQQYPIEIPVRPLQTPAAR